MRFLLALASGKKIDFIVQGNPGSGKTLLAVSLLLKAAENNRSCILALRNNRPQAILRKIFDDAYPGVSGMMEFFEPQRGGGIARFDGHVDLLVIDEAQRMENRIMPSVLQKADVCAIFLDETQRLNPPEQGTIRNFAGASGEAGRNHVVRFLDATVRCQGGQPYANWVEELLVNPGSTDRLKLDNQYWRRNYLIEVCTSIEELLAELAKNRSAEDRVALVASFTESPGKSSPVHHDENIRVGYPLTSGFDLYKHVDVTIPWLMTTSHYRSFWMGGRSNQLDRVASIYGAQGFESDYVGIIWGRDLLYRNGNWVLGGADVCYDNIDRLIRGTKVCTHTWHPEALDLVINRYHIFFTRGIKGTLIYCED